MKTLEHAEAQRNRILSAAERCFIEHGFHAASMANIADTAQVSAGLIYRYFKNKSAIVLAITERHLEERLADIAKLQSGDDLVARIGDLYGAWQRNDPGFMSPPLFLEISAEGSRDPQIGEAIRHFDQTSRRKFLDWMGRIARDAGHAPSDAEIRARAFALLCFVEGLAIRSVREPDADLETLQDAIKLMLPSLLSFSPTDENE